MANVPQDIIDTIKRMQREINELKTLALRSPGRPTIAVGELTVSAAGSIIVRDTSGAPRLEIAMFGDGKTIKVWDSAGTLTFSQ